MGVRFLGKMLLYIGYHMCGSKRVPKRNFESQTETKYLLRTWIIGAAWYKTVWRNFSPPWNIHISILTHNYSDDIMSALASSITSVSIVCSTAYSGADQRTHQSSASLAFVRGIHRWPSHYLNQCWNIVNWTIANKLQWNFHQIYTFSFKKMHLKLPSGNWRPFCFGLNVLISLYVDSRFHRRGRMNSAMAAERHSLLHLNIYIMLYKSSHRVSSEDQLPRRFHLRFLQCRLSVDSVYC